MTGETTSLMLKINADPEVNLEELAELTLQLRKDLMELDVDAVDLVSAGKAPRGAKLGEPVIWGALLVTLQHAGIKALVGALKSWLMRLGKCSIDLEIDGNKLRVMGNPSKEQQQLINTWVAAIGERDH